MSETPSTSKDPRVTLPKDKTTLQEKIESWNIGLFAQKKPLEDPNTTITEDEQMETTEEETAQATAEAILNESEEMHDTASKVGSDKGEANEAGQEEENEAAADADAPEIAAAEIVCCRG